jgi:radical SAM protein with 4Fe4S-binding SPASM domain
MSKFIDKIKEFFTPPEPLKEGFYHSRIDDPDSDEYVRLHLRINNNQEGTLIVNASKVVHTNRTATEIAKFMIDGLNDEQIIKKLKSRFAAREYVIRKDYEQFKDFLNRLIKDEPDLENTGFHMSYVPPYDVESEAPYRVDLALTYRCNNNCIHCYVERPKDYPELSTEDWKKIIDILWEKTVPQVTFTGGEATLREDLAELICHAEDRGIVTGLVTNGRKLSDSLYLQSLVKAGLDHIQITLESSNKEIHNKMTQCDSYDETINAIKNCVNEGIPVITNTTLTYHNINTIKDTVNLLKDLGLKTFACNAIIEAGGGVDNAFALKIEDLVKVVDEIQMLADELGLNFIWYSPTKYCELNPVDMGVGFKQCTAGKHNLCIEPDGSVIPCQSYFCSLGNILTDDWMVIWQHDVLQKLRNHDYTTEECKTCESLPACGGGCPLAK